MGEIQVFSSTPSKVNELTNLQKMEKKKKDLRPLISLTQKDEVCL